MNTELKQLCYGLQTAACALGVLGVLMWRTDGFSHYTYESARRANVDKAPVTVSDWQLQNAQGDHVDLSLFDDKLLLVNFIFTRCPTICQAQGTRYQQLQQHIETVGASDVMLLSVSIDPSFDTPERLQYYRKAHRGTPDNWLLTRPMNEKQLRTIVKETGLRVIPDTIGGYSHSESIHIVQNGKLTSIKDWDTQALEVLIANAGTT